MERKIITCIAKEWHKRGYFVANCLGQLTKTLHKSHTIIKFGSKMPFNSVTSKHTPHLQHKNSKKDVVKFLMSAPNIAYGPTVDNRVKKE